LEKFDMMALETVQNQYLGGDASLTCAPETAARIDGMVAEAIRQAHQKATEILKSHEDMLHKLAQYLLEKETITGEEFMEILHSNAAS